MANEILKIHHLKVVNFDKKVSDKSIKKEKPQSIIKDVETNIVEKKQEHTARKVDGISDEIHREIQIPLRINNEDIKSKDSVSFRYKNPRYITKRKSNNIIFRTPSKRKNKKNYCRSKTLCSELKQKISHHNSLCSSRLKKTIQVFLKEKRKSKLNAKSSKERRKNHKKNNQAKILFTRETNLKGRKESSSRNFTNLDDVFGFRKSSRSINPLVYHQRSIICKGTKSYNRCGLAAPKVPCRSKSCTHYPLNVITPNKCHSCEYPVIHAVHVVQFPQFPKRNILGTYEMGTTCEQRLRSCVQINPCTKGTSCSKMLSINECVGAGGDTGGCPETTGNFQSHTCGVCYRHEICKPVIKYILFFIIVLVWAPCILTVGLCWLVTYPLRPHYVRRNPKGCYGDRLLKYKYNACQAHVGFWVSFVKWIKSAVSPTLGGVNAITAVLKREANDCQPGVPKCRDVPNPTKKYTLYHTATRGWVMKPTCRNSVKKTCDKYKTSHINRYDLNDPIECYKKEKERKRRCNMYPARASCSKQIRRDSTCKTQNLTIGNRFYDSCRCFKNAIVDIEAQIWPERFDCEDMFLTSLKEVPCNSCSRLCPKCYPFCLTCYQIYKAYKTCCLFVLASCIWCPPVCCCYVCLQGLCRCLAD